MSGLTRLIHEIHRRSVWQVLLLYVGGSWAVLAAVDTLAGALGLPPWAPSLALFLLIVGLPIVLATAFIQEGTPSATAEQAGTESGETGPARSSSRRLFTWRNAGLVGVGAFALLGVATAETLSASAWTGCQQYDHGLRAKGNYHSRHFRLLWRRFDSDWKEGEGCQSTSPIATSTLRSRA